MFSYLKVVMAIREHYWDQLIAVELRGDLMDALFLVR